MWSGWFVFWSLNAIEGWHYTMYARHWSQIITAVSKMRRIESLSKALAVYAEIIYVWQLGIKDFCTFRDEPFPLFYFVLLVYILMFCLFFLSN